MRTRALPALADAAGAFLVVNAAACAGASLLALGGAFSPWLDVLTHFALIYVAGGAVALALAVFTPRWSRRWIAGLAAVTLAANAVLITPEFLRDAGPTAPPDAPGQIKIIQFNALRTNTDIGRITDWLIAEQPDFVSITEARHDLRDLIVKRTGWRMSGAHGSLMIFSREPRLGMTRPALGPGELHFVNATYRADGGPFEFVTAHLDWPTKRTHEQHKPGLIAVVAQRPRERMILTGDFNATPWSFGLRRMERRFGLTRRDRALATFPATRRGFPWPLPVLPIDHVYAGPGWATVSVRRGPRLGSDHYPLIVVLAPVTRGEARPPAGARRP